MSIKANTEYIIKTGSTIDSDGNITIERKQELVRCKDCKHADIAYCRDHKTISRTEIYCLKDENRHENAWFCADGERKES